MYESARVKFSRRAGFLLATLGRRAERSWGGFLRDNGLTTAEFTAVTALAEAAEGMSQGELALRMGIDARNAGAVVRLLRERAWVVSEGDPRDGRVRLIRLTDVGREHWECLQDRLAGARSDYLRALSEVELAELERLLNKLNDDHWDSQQHKLPSVPAHRDANESRSARDTPPQLLTSSQLPKRENG